MNKLFIFLSVITAIFMVFSGCSKTNNPAIMDASQNSSSSGSNSQTSEPSVPNEPLTNEFGVPIVEFCDEYGDLLTQIGGGKNVSLYGALADKKDSDAVKKLEEILDACGKEISVVAYSLDNKKAISYNAESEIFCACTIKAFYSLYNCMEMDKGKGSLDTEMVYKYEHRDPDWGTGDMKFSDYGTVFDMKTIITKSMTISDNVGYNMQVAYFGRDGYNDWVNSLSCPSIQIKPTVWALRAKADEHAVMWREIYKYLISGAEHSEFLYSVSTNTEGNFSTAGLSDVDYSHKQGFNSGGGWNSYSDAGIVWKDGNPYVLVILTNNPGPNEYYSNVMKQVTDIIHNELM